MSAGWEVVEDELYTGRVHVSPIDDLIAHELVGEDCICSPRTEEVNGCDCGEDHSMLVHSSLDGREGKADRKRRVLLIDARLIVGGFVIIELARQGWRRFRKEK